MLYKFYYIFNIRNVSYPWPRSQIICGCRIKISQNQQNTQVDHFTATRIPNWAVKSRLEGSTIAATSLPLTMCRWLGRRIGSSRWTLCGYYLIIHSFIYTFIHSFMRLYTHFLLNNELIGLEQQGIENSWCMYYTKKKFPSFFLQTNSSNPYIW